MGFETIYAVLPDQAEKIGRLQYLLGEQRPPVVSVIGKYNHGKSSLLNALVEREQFAVSDARETTVLSSFEHDGIRWLDTPGLDADVEGRDDQEARDGAWLQSDIRLFVHCVREGEFDQREKDMIDVLQQDAATSGRQTLIVLTQIEEAEDEVLARILNLIKQQSPGMPIIPVSAHRYLSGLESGSTLKVKKSGISELREAVQAARQHVEQVRSDEVLALGEALGAFLDQKLNNLQARLDRLKKTRKSRLADFESDYKAMHGKLHSQLKA